MANPVTDDSTDFLLRFWGMRGSIACSGPETQHYGGNTSCVEILCGDRRLIFDRGTGLRPLGLSMPSEDTLEFDQFFYTPTGIIFPACPSSVRFIARVAKFMFVPAISPPRVA